MGEGRPRVVYTRLRGGEDTFYYACARPVTPRGLRDANRVLYWTGDECTTGWNKFVTRIHALDF